MNFRYLIIISLIIALLGGIITGIILLSIYSETSQENLGPQIGGGISIALGFASAIILGLYVRALSIPIIIFLAVSLIGGIIAITSKGTPFSSIIGGSVTSISSLLGLGLYALAKLTMDGDSVGPDAGMTDYEALASRGLTEGY